ncbi:hypothetical protein [Vulcanisaeta sp. JCM 14467]|uniref:hypothetical protein n=1 Tax=Vulcanisaeta sp. JCM 14467 TaxID=1295370 RepID=UPI002093A12B|nr:hypothetical protein [Vulcanisaeta sp. JCM 14467]
MFMVTPLNVEILSSQPGIIEVEDHITIKYRIISVKAAKVGEGYGITATIDIEARFNKQPQQVIGPCSANAPYRPTPFRLVELAHAVVKVDGRVFEVYAEPIAVAVADGFITTTGEPCVAIHTAIGWTAK